MRWILAGLAVLVLVACSEPNTNNAVYKQLAGIMDDLNDQWNDPGTQPVRGMNVTFRVCSKVNAFALESMSEDESLSDNVDYTFYEKSLSYPDKSRNWTITRPLSWNEKQVLLISISPRDGCVAIYRHTN